MTIGQTIASVSAWGIVRWAVTIAVVLGALFMGWALVEARLVQVSRASLTSPHVPATFEGARIVFVADIHAGPYLGRQRVKAMVQRVNALEPDVVILGGDYVGGRAHGGRAFYAEIGNLQAPLGTYAVLGNHDHWEGADEARRGFADAGVTVLENANVRVSRGGESIRVAGVDDAWIGEADAEAAARGIDAEEFGIFVTHNPDYLPEALPRTSGAFDLALAGHTHAGQLTLFGMHAPFVPSRFGQRYRGGWLEEQGVPVLVTRGFGTVTVPMRFFNRPEINVIELRRGPASVER